MRLTLLPLIVAPLLVGLLPTRKAATHVPDAPLRRIVRFEDVVRNDAYVTLHNVRCTLLLPEDGPGQSVRRMRLSPHDWVISRDALGQRYASAVVPRLAPGEAVTFGWVATVELSGHGLLPHDPRPLTPDQRAAALADDPALGLEDSAVVAAADAVRCSVSAADPEALAAASLAYVQEHVDYRLEGGWAPAPEVLRAGSGSCTESTFAFVALCRRLGIPARWIGGTLDRGAASVSALDTTFHRLAEVWLPERGWVRVETTSSGAGAGDERAFGRLPRAMLVLGRGGASDGATGLYYHARNEWSAPRGTGARPRVSKRAIWAVDRHPGDAGPDGRDLGDWDGDDWDGDDWDGDDWDGSDAARFDAGSDHSSTLTNVPPLSSAISVR